MSSTSKQRLQPVLDSLDQLFAKAHPADVPELVAELREHLSRLRSASQSPAYTAANVATGGL